MNDIDFKHPDSIIPEEVPCIGGYEDFCIEFFDDLFYSLTSGDLDYVKNVLFELDPDEDDTAFRVASYFANRLFKAENKE